MARWWNDKTCSCRVLLTILNCVFSFSSVKLNGILTCYLILSGREGLIDLRELQSEGPILAGLFGSISLNCSLLNHFILPGLFQFGLLGQLRRNVKNINYFTVKRAETPIVGATQGVLLCKIGSLTLSC